LKLGNFFELVFLDQQLSGNFKIFKISIEISRPSHRASRTTFGFGAGIAFEDARDRFRERNAQKFSTPNIPIGSVPRQQQVHRKISRKKCPNSGM
jgi:hypothetical protein